MVGVKCDIYKNFMNWKIGLTTAFIVLLIFILLGFFNNKSVTNMRDNQSTTNSSADSSSKLTELKTETLTAGQEGRVAQEGDTISVHYVGTLLNGTKFDSSRDRGMPFEFTLGGNVIDGWNMGIEGMKVGEVRRLSIPSSLGYGASAAGSIPANSDLYFDVELLAFVD